MKLLACLTAILLLASPVAAAESAEEPDEITCIALLSIGRDLAYQTGNNNEFRKLTTIQNKVFLSEPQGAFPSHRINAIKKLYVNAPNIRIPLTKKCVSKWEQ